MPSSVPIHLDIWLPHPRLGPMTLPLVDIPIGGVSITDVLSPLEREPREQVAHGPHTWTKFKVALPAEQGLDVPLGPMGSIGFHNEDGVLRHPTPPCCGRCSCA